MAAHRCAARATTALPRGFDPRRVRREFPIFDEQSRAGVPRFRRQRAEAARGHRRRRRVLPHRLRQRASRRLSAERALDRAVRGGAREGARAFSTPPTSARSSSCAAPPRRSTSSRRAGARPSSKPATRSSISELEHHSNIVPWQMLRDRARHPAGRRADRRDRRVRPRRASRRCCRRAPGWSR